MMLALVSAVMVASMASVGFDGLDGGLHCGFDGGLGHALDIGLKVGVDVCIEGCLE